MNKYFYIFCIALLSVIAVAQYTVGHIKKQSPSLEDKTAVSQTVPHYSIQNFDFDAARIGLTDSQLTQHKKLYEGYVNKRNEVAQKLAMIDRSDANNRSFSVYRALKLAETYTGNGDTLHRLYFENIQSNESALGGLTQALIEKSFGSVQAFKKDLFDAAQSSHGWVVTAWCFDDQLLHNYVLEAHNQTVPVLVMPLVVLDVYEHAYMIDFGIARAPYLDVFWNALNWDVIEKRAQQWVKPFLAPASE